MFLLFSVLELCFYQIISAKQNKVSFLCDNQQIKNSFLHYFLPWNIFAQMNPQNMQNIYLENNSKGNSTPSFVN